MSLPSPLPGALAEIAEIAGVQAALKLAADYGGRRVYIPARAADDHWLVVCVGRVAADSICRHFAAPSDVDRPHVCSRGCRVDVPMAGGGVLAGARRAAARLTQDGASISQTAGAVGLSSRTIERLRGKMKTGSLPLFDESAYSDAARSGPAQPLADKPAPSSVGGNPGRRRS